MTQPATPPPQNIYNARNTTPGKAFAKERAQNISEQWKPLGLNGALDRLGALSRTPFTGINLDTLREQLRQRMDLIMKMHNDRLSGSFTSSSPFKAPRRAEQPGVPTPKPPSVPRPEDPAKGRGVYYPKPQGGGEDDNAWYSKAGAPPVPKFKIGK